LQTLISDLASTPLDYTKPLWQCHFIEGYSGGTVIMARLHHAIADGIALMYVLLSMADPTPEASLTHPELETEPAEQQQRTRHHSLLGGLAKRTVTAVSTTRSVTGKLVHESVEGITNPSHLVDRAKQGTDFSLAAGRLVLRTPDPQTILKGKLGVAKRVTWSQEPLSLAEVKSIKNMCGGTVNDVLVAAFTGGLRHYLLQRGADVEGLSFRAAMPVNIRPPDKIDDLGNQFGIVYPTLPVGVADPQERLRIIHERMEEIKSTPEAVAAFGILSGIGVSPAEAQKRLVDVFGSKASVVMTNVPGPQIPLYIAGKELEMVMAWVPQAGRVSLGVSIISYNDKVFLGVISDEGLIPDPDAVLEGFYEDYRKLLQLAQKCEAKTEAPPQADPNRCQAMTKAGRRCKNRSLDGSDFCRVHQENKD
jgi:WS/DGAT/MGAT family acyltransferase